MGSDTRSRRSWDAARAILRSGRHARIFCVQMYMKAYLLVDVKALVNIV